MSGAATDAPDAVGGGVSDAGAPLPGGVSDAGATAVSLIIGFPRRVTTTSSPAATRSSHRPSESRQTSAPMVTAASAGIEWS
jgi:hypothetical protein